MSSRAWFKVDEGRRNQQAATVDDWGPTSLIVSRGDMTATILENGEIVAQGKAVIKDPDKPLGSHVFVLMDAHDILGSCIWHGLQPPSRGQRRRARC
ncbi:MAG: hypothetical protein H6876_02855 [Hyphomicrobiaceae bacterium]|nr:hypothetical protein [Hyphomicrobiaceae bacterium]